MKRKTETFTRWDAAEHLRNEGEIAAYLQACADENDPQLMIAALGDVARARHHGARGTNRIDSHGPVQGTFGRGQSELLHRRQSGACTWTENFDQCELTKNAKNGTEGFIVSNRESLLKGFGGAIGLFEPLRMESRNGTAIKSRPRPTTTWPPYPAIQNRRPSVLGGGVFATGCADLGAQNIRTRL